MSILPFQAGDRVQWHGADARVIEAKDDRVALERLSDKQTIITTPATLRQQQPTPPGKPAERSA